jgi:predicted RNA-binding protein with PUA-like domain
MPYLLKTEPDVYSIDDLERDHETIWDGVANPQALGYLARMPVGEELVIYHTGEERKAAGLAKAIAVNAENPKVPEVRIRFVKKLKVQRTLSEMKALKLFEGSALVKQGRLGVVPLTEAQYDWICGND